MGLIRRFKEFISSFRPAVFSVRGERLTSQFNEVAIAVHTKSGEEHRLCQREGEDCIPFRIARDGALIAYPAPPPGAVNDCIRTSHIDDVALIETKRGLYAVEKVKYHKNKNNNKLKDKGSYVTSRLPVSVTFKLDEAGRLVDQFGSVATRVQGGRGKNYDLKGRGILRVSRKGKLFYRASPQRGQSFATHTKPIRRIETNDGVYKVVGIKKPGSPDAQILAQTLLVKRVSNAPE